MSSDAIARQDQQPLIVLRNSSTRLRTALERCQADLPTATHPYLATKALQRLQGELDTIEAWEHRMAGADAWAAEQGQSTEQRLLTAYRLFATLATREPDEGEHGYREGVRTALLTINDALAQVR